MPWKYHSEHSASLSFWISPLALKARYNWFSPCAVWKGIGSYDLIERPRIIIRWTWCEEKVTLQSWVRDQSESPSVRMPLGLRSFLLVICPIKCRTSILFTTVFIPIPINYSKNQMLWICRKIADRDFLLANLLENLGRTFRPAVWHFGVREPPTCHRDCEDSCSVGNHESESCWVVMLLGLVQLFSQSNTRFVPTISLPYLPQTELLHIESNIICTSMRVGFDWRNQIDYPIEEKKRNISGSGLTSHLAD